MDLITTVKRFCSLYQLGRKRFRSPEEYIKLMNYLSKDFATRVISPNEYTNGLVLDGGCSYAGYMDAFKANGAREVVGIDLSKQKLEEFQAPNTIVADITSTPFINESFDLVYSRAVIEHVPDQLALCSEIYRILKPGGYACITMPPWYSPNAGHPRLKPFHLLPFPVAKWLSEKTKGIRIEASDLAGLGLYPITIRKLRRHMKDSGFEEIRIGDCLFGMDWMARVPFLNEIITQHFFVVGRRKSCL